MQKQILKELRSVYENVIFDFKKNAGYKFYLLYKDKDKENYMLSDEDKIIEKIENIAEKYLKDDELEELVVVYDYLDEIEKQKLRGIEEIASKMKYQEDLDKHINFDFNFTKEKTNYTLDILSKKQDTHKDKLKPINNASAINNTINKYYKQEESNYINSQYIKTVA